MTIEAANRTANPARKGLPLCASRMMGLQTATDLLGVQQVTADALGIDKRSLRAKLNAERGVGDADLRVIATALDDRAARLIEHAAKLRALVAGGRQ